MAQVQEQVLTAETLQVRQLNEEALAFDLALRFAKKNPSFVEGVTKLTLGTFALVENKVTGETYLLDNEACEVMADEDGKYVLPINRHYVDKMDFSSYIIGLTLDQLTPYLATETVSLKQHMGSRYNYNSRIRDNTSNQLRYLLTGK